MIRSSKAKFEQRGWVMMEVILCLALFAAVLHVVQRQSSAHWQTIEYAQQQQKRAHNQQKQALMAKLTGSSVWLNQEAESARSYPDCQTCRGDQLERWFQAALYPVASVSDEAGRAP